FFSIRRRHTRFSRDWSSDVCSSDLDKLLPRLQRGETFIDPSRLAIDPELAAVNRALPYLTLRLAVIAITYFDTTSCVSMIRAERSEERRVGKEEKVSVGDDDLKEPK